MSEWLVYVVGILFIFVCVLLIIIILLQRGRGGGLAGAFGGAGGHSAFGAKTGDVFTWVTVALTGIFLVLAIVSNFVFVRQKFSAGPVVETPAKAPANVPGAKKTVPVSPAKSTTQPAKP